MNPSARGGVGESRPGRYWLHRNTGLSTNGAYDLFECASVMRWVASAGRGSSADSYAVQNLPLSPIARAHTDFFWPPSAEVERRLVDVSQNFAATASLTSFDRAYFYPCTSIPVLLSADHAPRRVESCLGGCRPSYADLRRYSARPVSPVARPRPNLIWGPRAVSDSDCCSSPTPC